MFSGTLWSTFLVDAEKAGEWAMHAVVPGREPKASTSGPPLFFRFACGLPQVLLDQDKHADVAQTRPACRPQGPCVIESF